MKPNILTQLSCVMREGSQNNVARGDARCVKVKGIPVAAPAAQKRNAQGFINIESKDPMEIQ